MARPLRIEYPGDRARVEDEKPESRRVFGLGVEQIARVTAKAYGKPLEELRRKRRGEQNEARSMATYLCRSLGGHKHSEIGKALGFEKTSSVNSVCLRMKARAALERFAISRRSFLFGLFGAATFYRLVTAESATQSLETSLSVNKREWSKGDLVIITVVIKNVSTESLYLPPLYSIYPINYIRLLDARNNSLKSFVLVHIQFEPVDRRSFRGLNPGEEASITFDGIVDEFTIKDFQTPGYPDLRGLFLDFKQSAILIPRTGTYQLRFKMEHSQQLSEQEEKQFSFGNIWYGSLVSEPIEIVIK